MPDNAPPLAGVKVVDISNFLAGPVSTMFLADFGAEVVKVERPDTGDELRFWGNDKDGVGLMFKLVNRNKQSVTADMRTPLGVEIVKRLVADADIVVENYRKGTLERWGLGYDVLSASTTYWVSVNDGMASNRLSYRQTAGDDETGAAGWSIGNGRKWRSDDANPWQDMAGVEEGTLTLTPEDGSALRPDLSFLMGAAGMRGTLLDGAGGGPVLTLKSDAMAVRTSTDAVSGDTGNLAAADGDVTRLRLALEGSRLFNLSPDRGPGQALARC